MVFTLAVVVTFVAPGQQEPVVWVTYMPLAPLSLLQITGLCSFVLPHAARWRGGRRTEMGLQEAVCVARRVSG